MDANIGFFFDGPAAEKQETFWNRTTPDISNLIISYPGFNGLYLIEKTKTEGVKEREIVIARNVIAMIKVILQAACNLCCRNLVTASFTNIVKSTLSL